MASQSQPWALIVLIVIFSLIYVSFVFVVIADCEPSAYTAHLIAFNALCLLMAWSNWTTVLTGPGTIPKGFKTSNAVEKKRDASERYCRACQAFKPDRAHHCRTCGRCVLRMDHHSRWHNTCIGHRNYKPFILSVFYTTLLCLYVTAMTILRMGTHRLLTPAIPPRVHSHPALLALPAALLAAVGAVTLGAFGRWHCVLVLRNTSTIEALEKRPNQTSPFDRGALHNWTAVFGPNPLLWPFPIGEPEGDGLHWRVRASGDEARAAEGADGEKKEH